MELNPIVKEALVVINFVDRYQKLSDEYSYDKVPSEQRLNKVDKSEIFKILSKIGFESSYDSHERFFKIKEEKNGKYIFGFHIILRDGYVDLIWVVKENDNVLLGSPWGTYSRRLISLDYKIKHPFYGSYDDVERILNIAFEMYKDFKNAVLALG